MKLFAYLLIIIISYSSMSAQETFEYIDHDSRNISLLDFLASDSLIYFAQDSDSYGVGLSFGSIDSSGTITRTRVNSGGHPGKTRFLNKGENHFDILYYDLIDYDISGPGLTEVKYRNGTVSHKWRLQEYGHIRFAHLNYAGDSLFTLRYHSNPQELVASLYIFDDDDELILEKEIPDNIQVKKFEGIGTDIILLQTEQSLYRLTPDNETVLFFDSSSPIREIINEENESYIINANEVWQYNLESQEFTLLFNHNIDFENVKFVEDHFVFHTKSSDINVLNRYSMTGVPLDTLTTINGALEDFTIINNSIVYPGTFNYGIDNNSYYITSWTKKKYIDPSHRELCRHSNFQCRNFQF